MITTNGISFDDDITLEDFMNNSGTRTGDHIYKQNTTRFEKVIYGKYGLEVVPSYKVIAVKR